MKRILSLLVAMVMALGCVGITAMAEGTGNVAQMTLNLSGNGTESDPYKINNLSDLKNFRDMVNSGNNYDNACFKLTADIDLKEEAWTPIGNGTNKFLGTFDGDNHTISNLNVSVNTDHAGLFGFASVIKNVKINNATVSGVVCVGALVGELESSVGTVDNCHVSGSIKITGENSVGGLAGKGYANIKNSSVIGDGVETSYVNGIQGGTEEGDNIGGIIGHLGEGNTLGVSNSTTKNITVIGTRKIGGIVGTTARANDIVGCSVDGVVIKSTATIDYANSNASTTTIGGIVGNYFGSATTGGVLKDSAVKNVTFNRGNAKSAGPLAGGDRVNNGGEPVGVDTVSGNTVVMSTITGSTNTYLMTAVAKIGETNYYSLQEAIAAVQNGETITLLDNVTVSAYVTVDKTITLDLNGKTIENTATNDWVLRVDGNSTLTLTDSSTEKNGTIKGWKGVNVAKSSKLIMDNGNIAVNGATGAAIQVYGSEAVMNGGKITAEYGAILIYSNGDARGTFTMNGGEMTTNSVSIFANGSEEWDNVDVTVNGGKITSEQAAIYWPAAGKLTITGGELTGPVAVYVKSGSLEITGGTLTGNDEKKDYAYVNSGFQSTGDALVIENVGGTSGYEAVSSVEIKGGNFISENAAAVASYAAENVTAVTGFISGGSFSSDVNSLCTTGFTAEKNEDGTYGVEAVKRIEVTDADGNVTYLANFKGFNKSDVTIKLLDNVADYNLNLNNATGVVLDLNGYTFSKQINLNNGAELTIKDSSEAQTGKVVNGSKINDTYAAIVIMRGTLNINGGTIETTGGTTDAAIQASCATVTINGGKIISNADGVQLGTWAINSTKYPNSVTITGGEIDAEGYGIVDSNKCTGTTVSISGGKITSGNEKASVKVTTGTASITGGTFSSDVSAYVAKDCAGLTDLNGNYVVGETPTATVNNLGATVVPAGEYGVWNGSSYTGTSTENMPLSFVMQFIADQTAEDMKTSPYADWYADFVITFDGIEGDSFVADGCYLAGYYGDFGWVKVPVDGMTIEKGVRYPVMLGVGLGQKYDYVCSGVQDFKCALYITPEILADNPNLTVNLELAVVDNSKGQNEAAVAIVNNKNVYKVTDYDYDAEDFEIEEVELFNFSGATVTLDNAMQINFFAKREYFNGENYYAIIEHDVDGGKTVETRCEFSEWRERKIDNVDYYAISYSNLSAKQIADEIRVTIYKTDGTQVSVTWIDGLSAYAYRTLKTTTDQEFRTALVDMLNYGAEAQKYFDYNEENLANADAEDYQQYATKDISYLSDEREMDDNVAGTTLVANNNIELTGYFKNITPDMYAIVEFTNHYGTNSFNYRVDSKDFVSLNSKTYGVRVDKLVVADAAQPVTITVYKGDGTLYSQLVDSINGYLARSIDGAEVFEAMAKFTHSTYNYFHKNDTNVD